MKLKMMMLYLCLAALFVSAVGCARIKGESKETVANREVKAAIADMASLMEQNQAKQMLEKYTVPATLEKMKSEGNLDRFAEAMNGPIREQVITSLKEMQAQTPTWNADFTEATFTAAEAERPPVVFQKIGDKWHVVIKRPGE